MTSGWVVVTLLTRVASPNLVGADHIPAGVQIEIRENLWLPFGEIPLEQIVQLKLSCKVVVDEATRPELRCVPQCWDS